MTGRLLHLDFETFGPLDLKKVGVENYVRAPGFAVTVIGWAGDAGPVQSTFGSPSTPLPVEVREHIRCGGRIKAWNANFEWHVLTLHYGTDVAWEQMDCVMQRALAWGLPGSLQAAGDAMGAGIVKDATARRLMLAMSKPRKDGTAWHDDDTPKAVKMIEDLAVYCERDVEAERAMDALLPALSDWETTLSGVDAAINRKGVLVDGGAVAALYAAARMERKGFDAECARLTGGSVTSPGTQTAKLQWWLQQRDVWLPDLSKEQVASVFDPAVEWTIRPSGDVARVLELRQLTAKSSVAKLERMAAVASSVDGRARNLLQFYGAGRTGRWAGRGIQVQNLPRPQKGLDIEQVIRLARAGADGPGMFYASPMKAVSSSLRGCLVAKAGHVLVSIDLGQIEARIVAWLAGQEDVLRAFLRGEDVYTLQANKIGSGDRQLGKVLTLACSYGMGPVRFRETAGQQYGVVLTDDEAVEAVAAWRDANSRIRFLWWDMENAVQMALGWRNPRMREQTWSGTPGGMQTVGRLAMKVVGGTLQVRKPGGGKLVYHNPRLVPSIDGSRRSFEYDGVDQKTNRWGPVAAYGGKLVENVVQATARDVMALGLMASHRAGFTPIMHLHDEIVWEVPEKGAMGVADDLRDLMLTGAYWTAGLPLAAEIRISKRFGK